ncbi:hypothetical protein LWI28_007951 [Acer negundo]|uniref:Uncharacterized protein n=1 Tax=Acer negundo TaxID=4023 RepID=A0AAD5NTC2_ACENE|nr:hypothetical protein LWI28_007951 [Acer negundo]
MSTGTYIVKECLVFYRVENFTVSFNQSGYLGVNCGHRSSLYPHTVAFLFSVFPFQGFVIDENPLKRADQNPVRFRGQPSGRNANIYQESNNLRLDRQGNSRGEHGSIYGNDACGWIPNGLAFIEEEIN